MSERIKEQLATGPVDEATAEELLRQAYAVAGEAAPNHIHWLDGPLELMAVLQADDQQLSLDDAYHERVPHCVWDDRALDQKEIGLLGRDMLDSVEYRVRQVAQQASTRIRAGLDPHVVDSAMWNIWIEASGRSWDLVRTGVGESIWRALGGTVGRPLAPWFRSTVRQRLGSMLWHTICAYDEAYLHMELRYFDTYLGRNEAWALAKFNELVSGYWLGQAVALLVRKPRLLVFDDAGRLHSSTGRCVEYPDGWGFYAWHGVPVSERVIFAPETLTREDFIGEPNIEARRIIRERMGLERFVWELAPRFIDGGPQGVLYEVELPDDSDEFARYVQLLDPSTGREYFLRVPPSAQTAAEAVAWTFGYAVDDYHPKQET
jgi:hypothetical protein